MEDSPRARIIAYLRSHNTMMLATEKNGAPFACSVFYVNDELDLYFVSETKTLHAQNTASNPAVAATISEDHHDWRKIQGLQILGRCELVNTLGTARALALYARKFPFVAQLAPAMAKINFYKLVPRWIRLVDNTRGFGFKEEIDLEKGNVHE